MSLLAWRKFSIATHKTNALTRAIGRNDSTGSGWLNPGWVPKTTWQRFVRFPQQQLKSTAATRTNRFAIYTTPRTRRNSVSLVISFFRFSLFFVSRRFFSPPSPRLLNAVKELMIIAHDWMSDGLGQARPDSIWAGGFRNLRSLLDFLTSCQLFKAQNYNNVVCIKDRRESFSMSSTHEWLKEPK